VSLPAPNDSLGALASLLGDESTREIVKLYLTEFRESLLRLGNGDREDQIRIAHGLKSSSLHMGASALSERMGHIEDRLSQAGETLGAEELAAVKAEFEAVEPALRSYAET
jgi:HPt (histidine-containing phosphotransfer) domain-containing protein